MGNNNNSQPDTHRCNDMDTAAFFPDRYWVLYQFSDIFLGRYFASSKTGIKYPLTCCDLPYFHYIIDNVSYEGSLVDKYLKAVVAKNANPYCFNNYNLLKEVIEEQLEQWRLSSDPSFFQLQGLPGPNTLVVHLRLGDVIDANKQSVQELLNHPVGEWSKYVKSLVYYEQFVPYFLGDDDTIQEVVLMGGEHNSKNATKSCLYTGAIKDFFEQELGVPVRLHVGMPPDFDVIFASQAKHFIKSGRRLF